jgi:hypothetical protein
MQLKAMRLFNRMRANAQQRGFLTKKEIEAEIQATRKCQTPIKTGIIPVSQEPENELFGIWEDREDITNVEQFARSIRKVIVLFPIFK